METFQQPEWQELHQHGIPNVLGEIGDLVVAKSLRQPMQRLGRGL